MTFRNEAPVLALAIKSLLAQSYENWELLLIDDGSSDRSLEVARSFYDPRIAVYTDGEHQALSRRMNKCIRLASGEYFARMDADDIAYPERLATQLQFLLAHPDVDLVATYVSVIGTDGKIFGKMNGPTKHEEIVKRASLGFRMVHPTWLGRLSWFRRHQYCASAIYAQDQELLFRAHRDSCYAVIPKILLAWRQDPLTIRKLMRARVHWMRNVSRNLHGSRGLITKAEVAGILSLKAVVDLTAVVTGLGYRILRHRALPVSDAEVRAYRQAIDKILGNHRKAS